MSLVVSKRGISRGRVSRAFSGRDLLRTAAAAATAAARRRDHDTVYVEVDESGWVTSDRGVETATVCARLAPHVHAANVHLTACGVQLTGGVQMTGGALRLHVAAELAAGDHVQLWFDEPLLALVDMPFLTPRNIRGKKDYLCHNCNVQFELPNHLKVHLFLECREYSPQSFWRRFEARLATAGVQPEACLRASAFRPYAAPAPSEALGEALGEAPARLEALATELGRSRDGHLCLYCGKLYSRKYGLKIHIRTHTGYKPLRCRYCLRAFGDPSNLNKHVRLHAAGGGGAASRGDHGCSLCGKRLARRRDLLRHVRARHAAHCHVLEWTDDDGTG